MRIEAPESAVADRGVEHPVESVVSAPPDQKLYSHCPNPGPEIDIRIKDALARVKRAQSETPKTSVPQPAL